MAKTCYFCGIKCKLIGKHKYWPTDGYNLCAECATEWQKHGGVDFLLENGTPHVLFHIDECTLDDTDDDKQYKGSLIFFDKAIVFLAEQKVKINWGGVARTWVLASLVVGALGTVIAGPVMSLIQTKSANPPAETAWGADSLREALQRAIFSIVIKKQDVRSITYSRWKGFTIETVCMNYNLIQMSKKLFAQNQERIQAYVEGRGINGAVDPHSKDSQS